MTHITQSAAGTNLHCVVISDRCKFEVINVPILQALKLYIDESGFWVEFHYVEAASINVVLSRLVCQKYFMQLLKGSFTR